MISHRGVLTVPARDNRIVLQTRFLVRRAASLSLPDASPDLPECSRSLVFFFYALYRMIVR